MSILGYVHATDLGSHCLTKCFVVLGYLHATDLGRTASHFYIKYDTVEIFNELLKPVMNDSDIFAMLSQASEFQQLKVREDEMQELDDLTHDYCEVAVRFS